VPPFRADVGPAIDPSSPPPRRKERHDDKSATVHSEASQIRSRAPCRSLKSGTRSIPASAPSPPRGTSWRPPPAVVNAPACVPTGKILPGTRTLGRCASSPRSVIRAWSIRQSIQLRRSEPPEQAAHQREASPCHHQWPAAAKAAL